LAAFYIVPAAYEQRWVNIAQALSPGLLPSENFLYTVTRDPEHTFFNYIASTIAVALIVFGGCAAIVARRKALEESDPAAQQRLWRALLVLAVISTILMLRPTEILWQLLPKLRFVQFPWRWMSILTVPFVYFSAVAISRRRFRWLWVAVMASLLLGTAVFLVQHTWWDDQDIPTLRAAITSGEGFDGADEYDPVGDDHYNLPQNAGRARVLPAEDAEASASVPPPAPASKTRVTYIRWTAEDKQVQVNSSNAARIELRLLDYPAWRVEVNGLPVVPGHAEDSAQIIVPVPAGESRITARFTRTADRALGLVLSGLSLLLFGYVWILSRRKGGASEPVSAGPP
jgi:hypothetical protein